MYRAQSRRLDQQAACRLRWAGTPFAPPPDQGAAQRSKAAESLIPNLPEARLLIADKAYASHWMHSSLQERGISACIPAQRQRYKLPARDPRLYRQRHRIENMFAKLKDWRRIHTRYDRCAHTFMSAICIAAAVIFWLNQ